ncbi:RHS repeat domain-containing protein [Anaeromyxobacter sp. Fw109-5]|uniref:RHS repeat domain-containing protein n=1 Tax=Anaeromyxobacter sp. (strain Fw109-5) TaxID=404589 RepID=UPI000158A5B6|nr:RHS repeat-associated core domain-containing protein [Anaeromyxobacter sp. Fw109-5]ABS26524.1 YD repeat protein [Anaeromyxobacter sp. Fw109-5]
MTSPAGTIDYGYDPAFDRLQTIASGARSTTLTWEAGGDRLLDVADGVLHECRRYDDRGRVTLVSNVAAGESCELSESPLVRYRYGYDERGNRTSEEYTGETVTVPELTSYGYDRADRLTGVAYADGTAKLYQLGGDGSRLAEKHVTPFSGDLGPDGWGVATGAVQTYGYDARGGLESITDEQGVAVVAYTVDLAGRVKVETRGTSKKELTWDAAGRLAEAKLGPAVAGGGGTVDTFTYRYDFAGRRIEKSGPTGDSRYLWGADDLVEEVAPSGTRLVYERMGGLVVGVSAYGAGGTPAGSERLMHDGLDTIVGRVRSDGSSSLYRYDAWGGFRGLGAPGAAEASLAYAGQHWDADVGLSYAQQRWYDPSVGRFLSEDPLEASDERLMQPGRLATFVYAAGNPLLYVDPLGLDVGQPESTSARAQQDMKYQAVLNDQNADAGNWLQGCAAGEVDDWRNIDGAAFNASSHSPQWLAGYVKCNARPVSDAVYNSDVAKNTREFWTATPARAHVMGCALGGGNGVLPVGDVSGLPASMQSTAGACEFGVGAATTVMTLGEAGVGVWRGLKNIRPMPKPALAGVTADGRTVAAGAEGLSAAERFPKNMEARAGGPTRISGGNPRHVNGAIAEEKGWNAALKGGHEPIQGPGKVSEKGPDFITYDPKSESIVVWDAKYRSSGKGYPKSLPPKKLKAWMPEVRKAVEALPDEALRAAAKDALENNRVTGEIFKWPPK